MSTLSPESRQAAPPKRKPAPSPWRVLLMVIAAFNVIWIVASPFEENRWEGVHGTMVSVSAIQNDREELRKLEESRARHIITNAIALQSAWICLAVSVAGLAMGPRRD